MSKVSKMFVLAVSAIRSLLALLSSFARSFFVVLVVESPLLGALCLRSVLFL